MPEQDPQQPAPPPNVLGISPDPRIRIKTTGTENVTNALTFKRTDNTWEIKKGDGTFVEDTGTVEINPVMETAPAPLQGDLGSVFLPLNITVIKDTEVPFTNAEVNQQAPLSENQVTFDLGVKNGNVFEVRLFEETAGELSAPVSQSYYLRSALAHITGSNTVEYYFAYLDMSKNPLVNFGDYPGDLGDAFYRWILVMSGSAYTIQSATGNSPPNFVQSTGEFGTTAAAVLSNNQNPWLSFWGWNGDDGNIVDNMSRFWTVDTSQGNSVYLEPSPPSPRDAQWNLIPFELGPHWTGLGVLGPKVSTICTVDDDLVVHYSVYKVKSGKSVKVYNDSGFAVRYSESEPPSSGSRSIDSGGTADFGAGTWYFQATGDNSPTNVETLTIGTA